jgi:hypothetical protein
MISPQKNVAVNAVTSMVPIRTTAEQVAITVAMARDQAEATVATAITATVDRVVHIIQVTSRNRLDILRMMIIATIVAVMNSTWMTAVGTAIQIVADHQKEEGVTGINLQTDC